MEKMEIKVMAGKFINKTFTLPFNPNEYTESITNSYKEDKLIGLKNTVGQFTSSKENDLTLNLLFDTTTESEKVRTKRVVTENIVLTKDPTKGKDVRTQLSVLDKISKIDKELHAPPPCQFIWGSLVFYGVVSEYSRKFVYFFSDGTPARANVTLKLKYYKHTEETEKEQRLESSDVTKTHQLKEGDSLFHLAYEEYQNPTEWRKIARDNKIDNPLDIKSGFIVKVLPKEK